MYYSFELNEFPVVKRIYSVTRNTVWQFSENQNLLILVTDGKCTFECDGEKFTARPGDIIFIPAGMPYIRSHIDKTMCTMTYIHFVGTFKPVQESASSIGRAVSEKIKIIDESILEGESETNYPRTIYIQFKNSADLDEMKSMYKSINLFSAKRQFMCDMQSSISLCHILASLSQKTIDAILTNTKLSEIPEIPPNLKAALGFITRNYSQPISLDDLADYCKVSKQQMIRYFKKAFNRTPTNYIIQYKITKAKEFLFRNPDLTIKEISAELGFDNQHYFTRLFKKHTGETPTHYRYRTVNYSLLANSSLPEDADL